MMWDFNVFLNEPIDVKSCREIGNSFHNLAALNFMFLRPWMVRGLKMCKFLLVLVLYSLYSYYSTILALIDVTDYIYEHLDKDDYVLGIYLDLQKAFDTADHTILLQKCIIMV